MPSPLKTSDNNGLSSIQDNSSYRLSRHYLPQKKVSNRVFSTSRLSNSQNPAHLNQKYCSQEFDINNAVNLTNKLKTTIENNANLYENS